MAKKKISEMSYEELKLYKEQLNRELATVNFYLRARIKKGTNCAKTEIPHK